MMGERRTDQAALFYEFSLERHVPATHLLRSIDRFVDLSDVRRHLTPFYSCTGRPSIDPKLLLRMLLIGYCYGIYAESCNPTPAVTTRSERIDHWIKMRRCLARFGGPLPSMTTTFFG